MLNKGDFMMKRYLLILAAALLLLTGCGKQQTATSQAIPAGGCLGDFPGGTFHLH